jgi:hypothetical protein
MCFVSLDLFPTISLTRSQPRRGAVLSDAEPALVALADRVGALSDIGVWSRAVFENPWSHAVHGDARATAEALLAETRPARHDEP